MWRLVLTVSLSIGMPSLCVASIADEIAALDAAKVSRSAPASSAAPHVAGRTWSLPDGRTVEISNYALVLFMGGSCKFSTQMNPLLKQFASERGVRIYPYTLDGGGDASFPTPMLPRRTDPNIPIADEIMAFFGQGLPIATPTLFLVNVNTMKAWPVSQGVMEMPLLQTRLSTVIVADIDGLRADQISPMLSGQTTTQALPR